VVGSGRLQLPASMRAMKLCSRLKSIGSLWVPLREQTVETDRRRMQLVVDPSQGQAIFRKLLIAGRMEHVYVPDNQTVSIL